MNVWNVELVGFYYTKFAKLIMYLYKFFSYALVFNIKIFILKKNWLKKCFLKYESVGTFKLVFSGPIFLFFIWKFFFSIINQLHKNTWNIFHSYNTWLVKTCYGFYRRYRLKLALTGLGNRIELFRRTHLIFKLGHEHEWLIYKGNGMFFKEYKSKKWRRNSFLIYCNNGLIINNFAWLVRRLKLPDAYNANGIRFAVKKALKLKKRRRWGTIGRRFT